MSARQVVLGAIYVGFALLSLAVAAKVGLGWGLLFLLAIGAVGTLGYLLGWQARDRVQPRLDPWREQSRVTPRPVPLEQRHIDALLAFGENCFGPMGMDDDHDDALTILRASRAIPVRDGE